MNRRKTLDALMKTTSQVVQCLDSVEYGLTDIQEYYANTGAMVRAMDDIQVRYHTRLGFRIGYREISFIGFRI